jgi:hypothetical protein
MGIKFITFFISRNSNSDKNENLRLYGAFEANIKDRYGNDTYEIAGIAFMGNDFNMTSLDSSEDYYRLVDYSDPS